MTQENVVKDNVAMAWLQQNKVAATSRCSGGTKGPNKQELLKRFILKTFKSSKRPPTREECMIHLYGKDKNVWKNNAFKNYCTYLRGGDNYTKKKYRIDLVDNHNTVYIVGYPNADFSDLLTFDEVNNLK